MINEEYYCPKCGLKHRILKNDTPDTMVFCIQCGERFAIAEADTKPKDR